MRISIMTRLSSALGYALAAGLLLAACAIVATVCGVWWAWERVTTRRARV